MTVGELKKALEGIPDDMLVGDSGHYGEYLECYSAYKTVVNKPFSRNLERGTMSIFCISIESPGDEPD